MRVKINDEVYLLPLEHVEIKTWEASPKYSAIQLNFYAHKKDAEQLLENLKKEKEGELI